MSDLNAKENDFPWEPIEKLIVILMPGSDNRIPKIPESQIVGLSAELRKEREMKHWENFEDVIKYRPVVAHGPEVNPKIKVGTEIFVNSSRLDFFETFVHDQKVYAIFADSSSNYFGIKKVEKSK